MDYSKFKTAVSKRRRSAATRELSKWEIFRNLPKSVKKNYSKCTSSKKFAESKTARGKVSE